jgi:predicted CoA-binding protein
MPFSDDDAIRSAILSARIIAVVGLSSKRSRASFGVSRYLQSAGYRIIPVNPNETEVLGEKAYPDLESIPNDLKIDIVNIFRRSEEVPDVVDAAIRRGAPVIWMQEGVIHDEAAKRARKAGILVVMDRCLLKEHQRLIRQA